MFSKIEYAMVKTMGVMLNGMEKIVQFSEKDMALIAYNTFDKSNGLTLESFEEKTKKE